MSHKEPLLFLCHRIPFPPNKGDKIRSFNILKELSKTYDIHLGSFVDDPYDWQYTDALDEFCQTKLLLGQNKLWCKVKGLTAFLTGNPISVPYYASGPMKDWVADTLAEHQIKKVFVYSSVMAQFVDKARYPELDVLVDFVDVDSDKWRQYAEGKSGIAKWVYHREWKTLAQFENKVTEQSIHGLFVSPQEAELFRQQLPAELHTRVSGVLNGVDTVFFDPEAEMEEESASNVDVVFTGAMDYWANVDAVLWFCEQVWPKVRESYPNAQFYIVGGNPTAQVKGLEKLSGVTVTGRVKDVRPFILNAKVVVAPLQIARGIQNKVLEAMSMSKPVIATTMAIEGIDADTESVHVTDDPQHYAAKVCDYLEHAELAEENRRWIKDNLEWNATLSGLPSYFEKEPNDH